MNRSLSVLVLVFALASNAIGQTLVGKNYITDVPDIKAYHIDVNRAKVAGSRSFTYAEKGTKFTVIDVVEGGAIILFWNYPPIGPLQEETLEHAEEMLETATENKDQLEAEKLAVLKELQNATKDSLKAELSEKRDEVQARLEIAKKELDTAKKNVTIAGAQEKIETAKGRKPRDKFNRNAWVSSTGDKIDYTSLGAYIDGMANGRHFLIDLKDLDGKCTEYYGYSASFTWGAVTIPIKVRFGNGSWRHFGVEPSANLGLFVGARRQLPGKANHAFNFLAGASMGSTAMRTVDFEKTVVDADTSKNYEGTGLILSSTIGIVYQYDSFQIGLFTGLDFMTSDLARNWHHQGVPWFGVGIGFGLFAKDKTENGKGTN